MMEMRKASLSWGWRGVRGGATWPASSAASLACNHKEREVMRLCNHSAVKKDKHSKYTVFVLLNEPEAYKLFNWGGY